MGQRQVPAASPTTNAAEPEGAENAIDMLAGRLVSSEDDVIEGISAFKEKRAPRY